MGHSCERCQGRIEEEQSFTEVHPIGVFGELTVEDGKVIGELTGRGAPEMKGEIFEALVSAEGVEQWEVIESLGEVIRGCAAGRFPDEGAPAARVAIGVAQGGLAHGVEELAFHDSPSGRADGDVRPDGDEVLQCPCRGRP